MKAHLINYTKSLRIIIIISITLIVSILFSGCLKEESSNLVKCNSEDYSSYAKVLGQILPSFAIEESDSKIYYILDNDGIGEAFDTQAVGALESGVANYWYPHYLATAIIAIDRDQTEAVVSGWKDLLTISEEIGFLNSTDELQMLIAAMSFGLEGEQYSLTETGQLLLSLQEDNRLKFNSPESPILICYDYQGAFFIKSGRNIEIVLPSEGTFTYEKGLLSTKKLDFQGNINNLLFESKMPLLNGERDLSLYPNEAAYVKAVRVSDYKHFATTTQNATRLIERSVLNSKKYMSVDDKEHFLIALFFIIVVTIWSASVLRRSMQKGISYAAFLTGIILVGWTLVRLIKYQVVAIPILSRYLWYSFYIFQLSLPLVLLWMAWAIDKPENEYFPPKWWQRMVILIGFLIVLVFTNDLHGLVFKLDLTNPDWAVNYSYGIGYYTILFISMMNLATVFIILLWKSIRNPRRKRFFFPLAVFFMFGLYTYKYIMRDPFFYQTDLTIVTGIFTMLMFESCIRSGLIPVNTKHISLFTRSPLKMQIINNEGRIAMASASSTPLNSDILEKLLASTSDPILQEGESLLFANSIPGGYAVWQEDVGKIYQLQEDIQKSVKMLGEANAILAEEEKAKRSINEEKEKKQLMEQLEIEIAESIKQLTSMIEKLPLSDKHSIESTRIALLLCYIKRRCNLFFREKEIDSISVDELIVYIDELSEIAKYSNLNIVNSSDIKGNLPLRYGTLFYDFFYQVVDLALQIGCSYIIDYLGIEDEFFIMRLLPSDNIENYRPELKLSAGISAAKGKIVIKDLEETFGISLSFPKGGVKYD